MPIPRYLTQREQRLAKLLGEIADLKPEAWERVQRSFDANQTYNTYDRIMT